MDSMATSSLFSSCDMLYAEANKGRNSSPSSSSIFLSRIFGGLNLLKTAIFKPLIKHESANKLHYGCGEIDRCIEITWLILTNRAPGPKGAFWQVSMTPLH